MVPPDVSEPLVLRSSRKGAVLCIVLVASVWCFSVAMLWISEGVLLLLPILTMAFSYSAFLFPGVSAVRGGDTVVDAHGVTRRHGRVNVHVPWEQVARISFKEGGIGVGHQLVLFERSGRPILLSAAPASAFTTKRELVIRLEPIYARAGLHRPRVAARPVAPGSRMAMVLMNGLKVMVLGGITAWALFSTSPWTQAWWPGRDEASRLPDACSVIDQGTIARLIPKADRPAHEGSALWPKDRSCAWGTDVPPPEMSVRLELNERFIGGTGGASERTHRFFRSRADRDCPSAISGVGDEACLGTERWPDGSTQTQVVARKGNVLVTVSYRAARPADQMSTETSRLTRAVINRIRFE